MKYYSRPDEEQVIEALIGSSASEDRQTDATKHLEILQSWRNGISERSAPKILAKVCAESEKDGLSLQCSDTPRPNA